MRRPLRLALFASALTASSVGLIGCDPCAGSPGTICTWAGTGEAAFNGEGLDRSATSFYWPVKVRFSPEGRAVLMDWNNHRVRTVGADDEVVTIIGNENIGDGPEDRADATAPGVDGKLVNLNHPTDFAFLPDGRGLLASWHNHKLRIWDPATGLVHVACGSTPGFKGDGALSSQALLDQPRSVIVDANGNILIGDQRNQRIRRIRAADQIIETVAGTGVKGFAGDGASPLAAEFSFPAGSNPQPGAGMDLDAAGRIFVADTDNHRIRMIDLAANTVTTIAGNGEAGFAGDGGKALDASLKSPRDVAVGPDGNLYVADTENSAVRKIDLSTGVITTVVGTGAKGFEGDGAAAQSAKLARPFGVTFDGEGNLFIADTFNNRIRRVAAWSQQ